MEDKFKKSDKFYYQYGFQGYYTIILSSYNSYLKIDWNA